MSLSPDQIEKYAVRVALGNNGGEWETHYTEQQKEHWRTFVRDLGDELMTEAKKQPAPSLFDQPEGVDWLLAYVASLAEKGIETGVTLSVEGQTIFGTVISGRKYLDELMEGFKHATYGGVEDPDHWRQTMPTMFAGFKQLYAEDEATEDTVNRPRSFLHLKDVTIVGGDRQPVRAGNWRIQLAKISGFTVGTLRYG